MIKSNKNAALSLLSLALLCIVAIYGPSYTQAAVLPIPRDIKMDTDIEEPRDLVAARLDPDFLVRRDTSQHAFAVEYVACGAATTTAKPTTTAKATTSTKPASTTLKPTSTTTKAAVTSAKVVTSTKVVQSTSTSSKTKTVSTSAAQATSTSKINNIVLTSNDANYGATEVMADLNQILKWAGDTGNVNSAQKTEIVAALLSACARYYPDMPTKVMVRIMLADITQESDYNVAEVSGGRLDSGSSWGLLQVSPGDGSMELKLFQNHANVLTHNFTYGMPDDIRANVRGPLLDYATGKTMNLASLTNNDLFRPWINIHVAMWIQSNLARTSSQDPYNWKALNDYSWAIKTAAVDISSSTVSAKWKNLLKGSGVATNVRTAMGSWVAGPAVDSGGYLTSGDDISLDYLNAIMRGVRELYGVSSAANMPKAWLETYTLNPGLIDYV
jgi:hypothetical protein